MYQFSIVNDGIVLHLSAHLASWAAAEDQRADLLGAYNARVSEITKTLDGLLDALSSEARTRSSQDEAHSNVLNPDVLRAFQDLTYRLAEAYDIFRRLPDRLDAKRANSSAAREYNGAIRHAARTACLICNKIKHNGYLLSRVDNFYEIGFYVEGFALFSRERSATLKICGELHDANKPGMSFNLALRSLSFDFLRADVAAGRLCSALGAERTEQPNSTLIKALRTLSSRPEIGLRFEGARSIPTMWEQSGNWVVGMKNRDLPFLGNRVQLIQQMTGDGFTRSFPIAG